MKREFNEEQRADLKNKAKLGIEQAEYFSNLFRGWMNQHESAINYAMTKYAAPYVANYAESYCKDLADVLSKGMDDIDAIFTAAEQVENEYAEKFANIAFEMDLYAQRINALRDVLRPAGPVKSSVFEWLDFEEKLNAAVYKLNEQEAVILAKYYLEGGKWQGYIEEQMGKDPKDITAAQYLAMIGIFDRLTIEDKAKFIEMSYRQVSVYPEGGEQPEHRDISHNIYFELSPVFATMAIISQQKARELDLSGDNMEKFDHYSHKTLFSNQILINVLLYASEMHFGPSDQQQRIEVNISKFEGFSGYAADLDHTLSIKGYRASDGVTYEPESRITYTQITSLPFRAFPGTSCPLM
jgi:hypothetical protein